MAESDGGTQSFLSWSVYNGDAHGYKFRVFEDLDELKMANLHRDIRAELIEALGVEVEELDI